LRKAARVYLINSVRGWMRLEREAADRRVVESEQLTPPLR
jgi:hypothetical protein